MISAPDGELSDAQLVAGCRKGDPAAWNALVERFSRYVSAIATQAFRLSEHDAEDVFQDVFAKTYERLGSLRSDDAIRPWIGQLTRNCCLDLLRSSSRVVLVEEPEERIADEVIAKLDEAMAVRTSLARLSPECQEVLDRFFSRDESYRTIGAALGIPAGTIASRISRCLGHLRTHLEGRNPAAAPSSE
ncbi:MAG: sigma-70 family RNA polymerase sigma factor [Thermoleophilia bacterium]|nr:sigma-70 family RNA polymerase sigma factor [Thermoleophilia bacterium]